MKNSGGTPQRDADDVLSLSHRDVEIGSDVFQAVTGLKAVNETLDPGSAVHNKRLAERLVRVHDDRR
jgi:hypothetical protein